MRTLVTAALILFSGFTQADIHCPKLESMRTSHTGDAPTVEMSGLMKIETSKSKIKVDYIAEGKFWMTSSTHPDDGYVFTQGSPYNVHKLKGKDGRFEKYSMKSSCAEAFPGWFCPKEERVYKYELLQVELSGEKVTVKDHSLSLEGKKISMKEAKKTLIEKGPWLKLVYGECL